jgi:hypothetical protein
MRMTEKAKPCIFHKQTVNTSYNNTQNKHTKIWDDHAKHDNHATQAPHQPYDKCDNNHEHQKNHT